MYINGNFGNMPFYGNQPGFPSPYPMPRVINDVGPNVPHFPVPYPMPPVFDDCGPKGGIIPNYHAPQTAVTINYFGKTGADLINYFGSSDHKTYTLQSYDCPPGVYTMVDMAWHQPAYPQPMYYPQPIYGSKGCATC